MVIAIYAGRFQPFHWGHFNTIKHILTKCDKVYVLICSKKGDNPLDDKNPFTFEERRSMMTYFKNKVEFRHICDQDSDAEWASVIEKTLPKGEKVCFTNNPRTREAFSFHGYKVEGVPIQMDGLSATMIRKLLIRNEDWDHLVPYKTFTVITSIRDYGYV